MFDHANYIDQPLDALQMARALAKGVQEVLQKKIDAVIKIANQAEESYSQRTTTSEKCTDGLQGCQDIIIL